MARYAFLLTLCGLLATAAPAQVTDDFDDGDLSNTPTWTGTLDRWTIADLDGSPALRSDGLPEADTLYLATRSIVSRGTWTFTFAHRDVNLSTFNGTRIFLVADRENLTGPVRGYFLQLGTNNSDEIRLYRQDGDPSASSNRVELAASAMPLLEGDANTLRLEVIRSDDGTWQVTADGVDLFTVVDATYATSTHVGVWVKHTSATGASYFFDDIAVTGEAGPVDATPPQMQAVVPSSDGQRLSVLFSEPLDPPSVASTAFSLTPGVVSIAEASVADSVVTLDLDSALTTGEYTLTVRDVRDLAGNRLDVGSVVFSFVRARMPAPRDVVINEILYDPPEADLEFVELINRSDETFDLQHFTLADDRGEPTPLTEAPTPLTPGGYAVLVQDGDAFARAFRGVSFVAVPDWPPLNNSGDAVVLSVDGVSIDSVNYAPNWGGEDASLERIDPAGASNSRFNWASSTADAGATPGSLNSQFAPDLAPPQPVFAEQIEASEMMVFFDEPLEPSSVAADDFRLGDGRVPQQLRLQDENTTAILVFDDALAGAALTVDSVQDLTGNALASATVPIAYRPMSGALLLNEIMYAPLADPNDGRPDQPEYVELYNASPQLLSLRGLYWTDVPDETGEADTLRLGTSLRAIAPDRFAVAYANRDAPEDQSMLQAAFPALSFEDAALLPQDRTTLGLVNNGDRIRLHRSDDAVLDEVFYDPEWHNPNLRDATGVALERLSLTAPTDEATNWTSCVADPGGTPGRRNSVALGSPPVQTDTGITIAPSPFSPDGDGFEDQTRIQFTLRSPVALVRARLFDARGRLVRRLEQARLAARTGELVWDGRDDDGRSLRMGIYVVLLEAIDTKGGTTEAFKAPVVLARPLD